MLWSKYKNVTLTSISYISFVLM